MIRFMERWNAIIRLVLFDDERGTVSEEARKASAAALKEHEHGMRAMDAVLRDLGRRRRDDALRS